MGKMSSKLRFILFAVYSIACAALLLDISGGDGWDGEPGDLILFAWMISPIGILTTWRKTGMFLTIGAGINALAGGYLYLRAFYGPDIDAQSGLVLIFLPVYQWIASGLLVGLALFMNDVSDSHK